MSNFTKYVIGAFFWSIGASIFTFIVVLLGAGLVNTEVVGIETWRLLILLFCSQLTLLMILIYLNNK